MIRSHLILSALNVASHYPKAVASGADVIAIDLEDSVPVDRKSEALVKLITLLQQPGPKVQVRVNPGPTDMRALEDAGVSGRIAEVIVPKVRHIGHVWDASLGHPSVVIIEEAEGVVNAERILQQPIVRGAIIGRSDMARSLGRPDRFANLDYVVARVAVAARAFDKYALDCCLQVRDLAAAREQWQRAAQVGIHAGACIHPSQVAVANHVFAPQGQMLGWCEEQVEAEDTNGGLPYIAADGGVVGRPHYRAARASLEAR